VKPILTKENQMSDYRTFLVPYDFSAHSREALFAATDLAKRLHADLHLLHVVQLVAYPHGRAGMGGAAVPPPIDMAEIREAALRSLRDVADGIRDFSGKVEAHVVEGAGIADMIRESAEKLGADLIVMGTHGRTGWAHVFLGSVTERTLRSAPCPVLTIRSPEEEAE
jgi:nucleotide-binding universal stress UspA family protein